MFEDVFTPDVMELARRRMNNEIYKQSALSAAKNEGRAEGIAIGEARGRAERDAEFAANLKAMGMPEEQIKIALTGKGIQTQEPQVQKKSPPKHGRR